MSLVLSVLLCAAAPALPEPGAEVLREVLQDEVIEAETAPDDLPGVVARFTVAAPAAVVLDQLWDGRNSPRIFKQVKRRSVVERPDANSVVLEYELEPVIGKMTFRQRNVVEKGADGSGIVRWVLLSGDLDAAHGHWRVTSLGPSLCRVEYESFVGTGPKFLYGVIRGQMVEETHGLASKVRTVIASATPSP